MDEDNILSFFDTQYFRKKELLLEEGKFCNSYFFVVKGCLRLYFIDSNGLEQTLQFALENWWMTDLDAFRSGRRSAYTIQALEATEVLVINAKNYALLPEKLPLMEKYFRLLYERSYAASLSRVRMISRMPKNEIYGLFESKYPNLYSVYPKKYWPPFWVSHRNI